MTSKPFLTMVEAIDVVLRHLENEFSNQIASLYFGDIMVYPPNTFRNKYNEWAPVIAVSPVNDALVDGEGTMNSETRIYTLEILVMVNYTPYISVPPEEAMGERMLSDMTEQVRRYFAESGNLSFDYPIQNQRVASIDWGWSPTLNQPIRGAAINYQIKLRVPRQ